MAPEDAPTPRHQPAVPLSRAGRGEDDDLLATVVDAFASSVSGAFTAEEVLRRLVGAAVDVLDVDGAGVVVADAEAQLRFSCAQGSAAEAVAEIERLQERLQDGPCRESHLTGRVVEVDLGSQVAWPAHRLAAEGAGLRGVTAVPLRARGRSWGVLDLYRRAPRRLERSELAAARMLATLATSYLVVAADRDADERARSELARRAMHDPLTDLPVRWVLVEHLERALSRLARRGGSVGVLFLDLDGLKHVNDTHGHAAGDELLVLAAERVRAALRPADLLARVGGDEFVVLLEDLADPADAEEVASRVLARLAPPHRVAGRLLTPSASIGVASTHEAGLAPDALVARADWAMYRAKRAGGGRLDVFDGPGRERAAPRSP